MLLKVNLIDFYNVENKATALIDIAAIEYDFRVQAMLLRSSGGFAFYKKMSRENYERMCDSFSLNADFRSGRMLNMNSLGDFVKVPTASDKIAPELWHKALDLTILSWDSAIFG